LVNQRFDLLKNDLAKESQMRNASIVNLEQCIENDFEKIETELKDASHNGDQTDQELNKIFDDLLDRVTEENDQIKKDKDATEQNILEQLKHVNKIRDEIADEKRDRENVEETLLSLLESTCGKLEPKVDQDESQFSSPQKVVPLPS
jgi:DNA polymerase III gamma/tau subunit